MSFSKNNWVFGKIFWKLVYLNWAYVFALFEIYLHFLNLFMHFKIYLRLVEFIWDFFKLCVESNQSRMEEEAPVGRFSGSTSISAQSWLDPIQKPNNRIEGWRQLASAIWSNFCQIYLSFCENFQSFFF